MPLHLIPLLADTGRLPVDWLDMVVMIGSTLAVAAYGMYMGRREEGSSDYFLAGRSVPWWAVAGSIFGTNISSHHLVGMMGAGMLLGFAQANFEYGAIFGLMMLCYFFLPLYRRMGVYTLSEYLGRRYDDRSRLLYSLSNMAFVLIQMAGVLTLGALTVEGLTAGSDYAISYTAAVVGLALVAAAYTGFGGLKAVIYTDVVQSVMLLIGVATIAVLAIYHPSVGGIGGLLEKQPDRFHVFFPADDPDLPWTGVLTGLMVLHFNYWGTSQFMVQRGLGAKSGWDARMGIIVAGFFKLTIPFLCIVPGMAAVHILTIDPKTEHDMAFAGLTRALLPTGYGLVGVVMAGLIGAILSTVDSMMNSTATLFTFDIYQKYLQPRASEQRLIWVGRASMTLLVIAAIALSLAFGRVGEAQHKGVFNTMVSYESYLVPGVLVAFLFGALQANVTATGSFACILAGPIASVALVVGAKRIFDHDLQTFHRVALAAVVCYATLNVVSRLWAHERTPDKEQYIWWRYRHNAADDPTRRPPWQNDRAWAGVLVAITLAMCWYFR